MKAKIKSCNGNICTNFYKYKVPKEGSQYISLSGILIDSGFRTGKNYCLQVFVEECIYAVKEKKIPEYISLILNLSDEEYSNEENSDEENFDEEN